MKTILFLTFMFIQFSFVVSSSQYYTLYPIVEKQKWGYINNLGEVVIEPQFYAADKFVEGLAAVRSVGYYGFIDTTGRFVISAKFDFAYAFQHGLAQVFVDGKPFIIDKEGEKLFDHNFKAFGGFDDRTCSVVRTKADEYGIIDQEGLLVLDTIYERISNFQEGRAIVTGARDGRRKNEEEIYSEIGLLDENGNFVIPFGVYDMIDPFENGFAKVWKEDKDQKRKEGIIDKDGKLQFWLSDKEGNLTGNVSESLIAIDIHTVDFDTIRTYTSSSRYSYKGYMNLQGELVFFNENWKEATDFNDGRAFVKDFEGQWYMIDKKGNVINQDIYYAIYADTYQPEDAKDIFQDGIALVKTEGGIGGIDTLSNFIIPPKKLLYKSPSFRDGEYLFLRGGNCGEYAYSCYTWWNIKTGQILENSFPDLNLLDEVNSIFRAKKEQQLYYLNEYGKVIWKQKAEEVKNIPVNVDFMCRGYFYASSPYKEELAGSGGWGGSSNSFYAVKKTKSFKRNRLNLYVNVKENVPFQKKYKGRFLHIANLSKDTLFFDVQDSRLYLKLQAKDQNGRWKDIEHLPSSWCGHSYHQVFLPPKKLWSFAIPIYEGVINTQLRAQLMYKESSKQDQSQIIYSNEFEGSVNPAQFWRKQDYTSSGLMDPYVD